MTKFSFACFVFCLFLTIDPVPASDQRNDPASQHELIPSSKCLAGKLVKAKLVTHYMVPLLDSYDHYTCDTLEGTCIYKKNGIEYLHNYGYTDEPLSTARCKNGYGNKRNCLNPCRTVAASMAHHKFGQIIYMKELVGLRCGNKARDGFEMIHDGFVVVADTGSPKHFNATGRFDFFWGRCKDDRGGECFEGGTDITAATSYKDYCVVWDPRNPDTNKDLKNEFVNKVRSEAHERKDFGAEADFKL